MVVLDYNNVDAFVSKQQKAGNKVRWQGWTMVFFHPHKYAVESPKGRRWGDEWGFETRIGPNSRGQWRVTDNLVKHTRPPRN